MRSRRNPRSPHDCAMPMPPACRPWARPPRNSPASPSSEPRRYANGAVLLLESGNARDAEGRPAGRSQDRAPGLALDARAARAGASELRHEAAAACPAGLVFLRGRRRAPEAGTSHALARQGLGGSGRPCSQSATSACGSAPCAACHPFRRHHARAARAVRQRTRDRGDQCHLGGVHRSFALAPSRAAARAPHRPGAAGRGWKRRRQRRGAHDGSRDREAERGHGLFVQRSEPGLERLGQAALTCGITTIRWRTPMSCKLRSGSSSAGCGCQNAARGR